jgi:type III secretory pathway component EscV
MLVVASLLVPLPVFLLDILLVLNFIIAIGLVVVTLQLTDSLQLSSLPTILLLSTLFRLCLNVTSTRMILTYGVGGNVIESFGSFVLGGSVGVGIIIFIMLSLIQFIVVAKGSERVAEVAARFTLDALPGKQMAIDADVRAGLYDMQTARQKRQDLQLESRFYGALDGAMKFVKGDAIAAMCIVVINGIGGVLTGIMSGMSFADTIHHYSVLTVGDGIASQIPSLLNSLAAGLVVTRVAGGKNASLSIELIDQVVRSKIMLRIGACILLGIACIPGFPKLALIISAGLLFLLQFVKSQEVIPAMNDTIILPFQPKAVPLLLIRMPKVLIGLPAKQQIENARKNVFESSGILLSSVPIEVHQEDYVVLEVRGVVVIKRLLTVDQIELLQEMITVFCLTNRTELIDDTTARKLLDFHEPQMTELATTVVPHIVSLTRFTEVLRALAQEEISLRPFDVVLQGIAELHDRSGVDKPLSEELRSYMKRYLCAGIIGKRSTQMPDDVLRVALLNDCYESLPWIDGVIDVSVILSLKASLQHLAPSIDCLLVPKSIRRPISEWLRAYGCIIPVMTHTEVMPHLNLEVVSKISIEKKDVEVEDELLLAA